MRCISCPARRCSSRAHGQPVRAGRRPVPAEPSSARKEAGYVNYDLHESVEEPGLFSFYENWETAAHLDAHLQTPHLVEFAGRLEELLDEQGLTINRLRRIA